MTARHVLLAVLLGAALAYFAFDPGRFLNLEYFKSRQVGIEAWRAAQPLAAALIFFLIYVVVTVLSLPGTAIAMTLAAGALFGLFWSRVSCCKSRRAFLARKILNVLAQRKVR